LKNENKKEEIGRDEKTEKIRKEASTGEVNRVINFKSRFKKIQW